MTTHDNAAPPLDWKVERRPCPFCTITRCGCPNEPAPIVTAAEQAEWDDH